MKKFLFLALILICFSLSGCKKENDPNEELSPIEQLDVSMESLNSTSYTVVLNTNMSMNVLGQTQNMTMVSNIEADAKQSYAKQSMNVSGSNIVVEVYTIISEKDVTVYTKQSDDWVKESVSLDEYTNDNAMFDIETKDVFEYIDGVYVGDVTALNQQLESVLNEQIGGLGAGSNITADMVLTKYNIILENGLVKTIDLAMTGDVTVEGYTVEYSIDMNFAFSKIGETKVTVPSNLPTE